ncbi:SRPBCC domain-containing protein [Emticicia sp. SJ17W-69]|uniref:SRPBCC domain-containing protein n=1 Tax=Emticicia sp. SJ17W-69 TaxID=3421657 RepID=UPI003EB7F55A
MKTAQNSDTSDREISVSRLMNAPIELVWEVWTNPEHIKKWWGPTGFTNTIDKMEVKPEGIWEFVMHGPDGVDYKNKSIFKEIDKPNRIVFEHITGPKFLTTVTFTAEGDKTFIHWHMLFESKEQFEQVVKTFKADEGLKQNVDKLSHYLQAQITIRKQLKTNKMARVSTYLNFPGTTEEAFNFYKSVFGGEFNGGIQRFGEIPAQEGMPPLSDEDKKLILHIELPILGGYILMATDAPESFGMKVNKGDNMHINLEPDSREETKRLFDALSAGGNVTMELQDMFWGAYYGSFTDKYGINWMVNFTEIA